jgi:hypothetical protein
MQEAACPTTLCQRRKVEDTAVSANTRSTRKSLSENSTVKKKKGRIGKSLFEQAVTFEDEGGLSELMDQMEQEEEIEALAILLDR